MAKSKDTETIILNALDDLVNIKDEYNKHLSQYEELIHRLLGPVVAKKLAKLDAQLKVQTDKLTKEEAELRKEIGQLVGKLGRSVDHDAFTVVYVQPKVKWDNKMLDGMAAIYPEIEKARTVAEYGSAQIRPKKEG
jgi:hypothetical protein